MSDNDETNQLLAKIFKMASEKEQEEVKPPPKQKKKREYTEEQKAKMKEHLANARVKALEKRRQNIKKKKGMSEPVKEEPTHDPVPKSEVKSEVVQKVEVDHDGRYNDLMSRYSKLEERMNAMNKPKEVPKAEIKPPPPQYIIRDGRNPYKNRRRF